MKFLTSIVIAALIGFSVQSSAQNFTVSKEASNVAWEGKRVASGHNGTIDFKSGTMRVNNGQVTTGVFEIDMTTIKCTDITDANSNQRLVNHLNSDDFFSVSAHPASRMTITGVKQVSGNNYEYTGNLTIKGITHPITFNATTEISGSKLTANGKMVVDRSKYDVKFGSGSFFENLGDRLILDEFTLDFTLVANAE